MRRTAVQGRARSALRGANANAMIHIFEDREVYARLDQKEVRALAHAAQEHWSEELSDFGYLRVERFAAGGEAHWMSVWSHGATGLEFVLVPGGTFTMGSSESERRLWAEESTRGPFDDEIQHEVSLGPFLMARTECTQEAWAKVAGAAGLDRSPSYFDGSRLPVESVSWEDASRWCEEAGLTLPTEAQWEYACRAGTRTAYAFGDVLSSGQARFDQFRSDGPVRVGSYGANAFGLQDMHGNVLEWCRDWYGDYGVKVERRTGLREGTTRARVMRGGCFHGVARSARSAQRDRALPGDGGWILGFRPALDLR